MDVRSERNERWKSCYESGFLPWHISGVNFNLKNHFKTLIEDKCVKGKRILVPLCGKSVDIKFFYEHGMHVAGIEVADAAIQDFSKEHNIKLNAKQEDGYVIHSNDDGRLNIYQGDLFEFTPEKLGGRFDYWWDCGSMTAISNDEIQKYVDLIFMLTIPKGRGLLSVFDYEANVGVKGPPDSIPQEKVEQLCGDKCSVKLLSRLSEKDVPEEHTSKLGNSEVYHALYLLEKLI